MLRIKEKGIEECNLKTRMTTEELFNKFCGDIEVIEREYLEKAKRAKRKSIIKPTSMQNRG